MKPRAASVHPRTPSKALLAEWDGKLAADGFRDIESRRTEMLSNRQAPVESGHARVIETEAYLSECVAYGRSARWSRGWRLRDRPIWKLHADGYSDQEIATKLGWSKSWIDKRVRHIRAKMLKWRSRLGAPGEALSRQAWATTVRFADQDAEFIKRIAEHTKLSPSATVRRLTRLGGNYLHSKYPGGLTDSAVAEIVGTITMDGRQRTGLGAKHREGGRDGK